MPHFHRICFSAMAFSVYCFLVLFLSMWQLWHFSAANWSFFGKVQSLCDELVTTLNWCTTAETVDKIWYDVIYYQGWLLQSVWTMWIILSKGFMIMFEYVHQIFSTLETIKFCQWGCLLVSLRLWRHYSFLFIRIHHSSWWLLPGHCF